MDFSLIERLDVLGAGGTGYLLGKIKIMRTIEVVNSTLSFGGKVYSVSKKIYGGAKFVIRHGLNYTGKLLTLVKG